MMNKFIIALCGLCTFLTTESNGATITAVSSGNWSTNSTWSCNCQPSNADNVVIPAGITVSNTAGPVILTGGPVITVTIFGTLALNSGGTLIVDSNDIVKVMSGGKISGTGILDAVWSGGVPIFVPNGTSINGPKTITAGSLPITLLFFNGQVTDKSVLLEWASASEKNFDFYTISRCARPDTSGHIQELQFETVAEIKGAGNSTRHLDYSFEDTHPRPGVSYYRLQSVDLDGLVETFDLITVKFEANQNTVQIFPNPVIGNKLCATFNFPPQEGGQIAVYDDRGGMVLQNTIEPSEKAYAFELPASIGKGLYFVVVQTKTERYRTSLIVR